MAKTTERKKKTDTNNTVGRPLKFANAGELQVRIDEYFHSCYEERWDSRSDKDGNVTWHPSLDRYGMIIRDQIKPFTISGLAVFLGTSRQTLLNYEETDEFFDTITRAKAIIENYAEEQLFDKNARNINGIQFNLNNNYKRWTNKQEVDMNATLEYSLKLPPKPGE
jgi:hypothetical protein